jgi:hypothetical protein
MPLSTELQEVLARSRRRPPLRDRIVKEEADARAPLLREHNDGVPADDSDDVIDPNDSGPRLSVTFNEQPVAEIYALPVAQTEQTPGRDPHTLEHSSAPQSPHGATAATAGAPPMPDLLDPVALRTMPPRVAAFMLYEPREPPPWRRQETLEERAHRVQLEDCGSWVGE